MADGANTTLDSFTGRSGHQQDFSKPVYRRREARMAKPSLIADIAPRHDVGSRRLHLTDPSILYRPDTVTRLSSDINLQVNEIDSNQTDSATDSSTDKKNRKEAHLLANLIHLTRQKNKLQLALMSLAVVIVAIGGYISFSAWQTNRVAQAAAIKLTAQANKNGSGTGGSQALSTVKPSAQTFANYAVAPNLPKYLKIPAIGVDAIVGQTGILANGALGTPDNVFYTDWYTGSAEPGQPGATLIDGHVSSWTAHGVFYNLHTLKAGDTIQIVKGDNTVVNYQVVKTQVYGANNVNMQAAITPITPGVSGLNLITCTGQVIKGTSLFNERVIVFAKQV